MAIGCIRDSVNDDTLELIIKVCKIRMDACMDDDRFGRTKSKYLGIYCSMWSSSTSVCSSVYIRFILIQLQWCSDMETGYIQVLTLQCSAELYLNISPEDF